MHPINEIFAAVETLRFIEDAEASMQDHPAANGHAAAMGYIAGLVADRLEHIGQNMDDREWRPTAPQDGQERTVTH